MDIISSTSYKCSADITDGYAVAGDTSNGFPYVVQTLARNAPGCIGIAHAAAESDYTETVQVERFEHGKYMEAVAAEDIALGEYVGFLNGAAIDADTSGDYIYGICVLAGSTSQRVGFVCILNMSPVT